MFQIGLVLIVFLSVNNASPIRSELWNEQIDLMIYLFDTAAKEKTANLQFITAPNMTATNISLTGVKLGLMWSLKRDSDVIMEINGDDMRISGQFTLKNFKLIVNQLKYKSFNGPANFTATKNGVDISYNIRNVNKPRHCKMEWELFQLKHFRKLKLITKDPNYKKVDVTEEINTKLIPELNTYFKTQHFKKYLNSYIDFCFSAFFK